MRREAEGARASRGSRRWTDVSFLRRAIERGRAVGRTSPKEVDPDRLDPDTRWREITHLDRGGIRLAPPFGCLSGAVPPG